MKRVFTVGEVAELIGVQPRTVSAWFDSGKIRGMRVPEGFRVISRAGLEDFLISNGCEEALVKLRNGENVK